MSRGLGGWSALHVAAALFLLFGHAAFAATVDDTLNVDLAPLIDQAAQSPTRFAIDIPHAVSADQAGTWTSAAGTSTWTYSVRVPTAVSMSLHASRASLPTGAVLTITGNDGTRVSYRAGDVSRGGLWSRPLPGDTLFISLSLSDAQRTQAVLQIESLQAGYRSLGGLVPDHPEYRRLFPRQKAQANSCTENYSCEATTANQGPAQATVAVLVANVDQCTGTLLNDTSGDGIPYVLTARHCENDALGGGAPSAAADVTVYWDAVSPCSAALGSIFDGNAIAQTGATTVVEQQDAWLIRLDAQPAANDAYYAGWDATGGVFSGGYSIHHALGYDKQYVEWYGQPILQSIPGSTLQIGYTSTFWGVVNAMGSVGAGASGGAFFDPNNHVVGSGTVAALTNGPNSAGVCPVSPPAAPSPATITAQYTALSAVWSSTSDTTSSTGSATLQSALDAAGTGQLVLDGLGLLSVTLTADQSTPLTGQTANLTWNAPGAQTCTASGGLSGDGWTGSLGASGTRAVTEQSGGQVTYSLRCTASGEVGIGSVTLNWQLVPAVMNVTGAGSPQAYAGSLVQLQWASNTQPCTASGGTPGDGWAGSKPSSGTQSVLVSVLGSVTYNLTCGTGGRVATGQYTVTVLAPYVSTIQSDANNLRIGQPVNLEFGAGGTCTKSGGATGDGWAGPLSTSGVSVTEPTAGTYTYTVTCTGTGATANLSSSNSITLTFTNAPATATLTPSPVQPELYTDPGAQQSVLTLSWTSNVRPCAISLVGPGISQEVLVLPQGPMPSGTTSDDQLVAGNYVYTVTCGTAPNQAQASTTVNWFTNDPSVTITIPNQWPLGTPSAMTWQSNLYPCTATGGGSGDGWAGSQLTAIGHEPITESTAGPITFGLTCGAGAQTAQGQATTTVIAPTASLTAGASTAPVDTQVLLQWAANFDNCTLTVSPDSGSGVLGQVLASTGQLLTTELIAGTYTYTFACAGAQATTEVTYTGSVTTLTASASSVPVGSPVRLTWNSEAATSCTTSGGTPGDGWSGTSDSEAGSVVVTSSAAEPVTYSISCKNGQGTSTAQVQVSYTPVSAAQPVAPTPSVSLKASAQSEVVGSSITLTWSSDNASACTASGGGNADGWSGSLALSGTMSITEATAGSYTYSIVCSGAPPAATAQAQVDFTEASSVTVTASSGGGKSGGGGAVDLLSLLLLALSLYWHLHSGVTLSLRRGGRLG